MGWSEEQRQGIKGLTNVDQWIEKNNGWSQEQFCLLSVVSRGAFGLLGRRTARRRLARWRPLRGRLARKQAARKEAARKGAAGPQAGGPQAGGPQGGGPQGGRP